MAHCRYYRRRFSKCRNPNQRYCNHIVCQRRRKNLWRQAKRTYDSDYKSNQEMAHQRWKETHKNYWQNYRATHPDYVNRNRELQRVRDQKRTQHGSYASPLASCKRDALADKKSSKSSLYSGIYRIFRIDADDLAKRDAFTAKISVITRDYPMMSDLAKSPPYSQGG